jgi:hypothetical protein
MKKILLLLFALFSLNLLGITYQEYNPNDEQFKILALQKAKMRLKKSEKDYKNAEVLFKKKFISEDEFESYKLQYENDKLNFQQYLLSVIFENPHLTIINAIKSKNNSGEDIVDLTLKNSSGGSFALEDDIIKEYSSSSLKPNSIFNVYISLKDDSGNIISQPYEYHINELKNDEEKLISFKVLKDVQSVIVASNYGSKYDEKKIWLKRKSEENILTITPDIYAQEVESGQNAEYNLTFEYFGEVRNKYGLTLKGLPKYFNYNFVNTENNAVISNLYFSSNNPKQVVKLSINVPEKINDNVVLDKVIDFSVNLIDEKKDNKKIFAKLELTPTGKASFSLAMNNHYLKIFKGDKINLDNIKVINDGMKDISNIDFQIFLPSEWEKKINPDGISLLPENQQKKIMLEITPNKDVLPGIYQIKIKASARNLNHLITTSEHEIKVEIENKSNPLMIIIVIIILLIIIGTVVYLLLKLTKK